MTTRRKILLAAAASSAVAWPALGFTQAKKQPVVVGVLTLSSRGTMARGITSFKEELTARGWNIDAQLVIEEVYVAGQFDRLSELAQALAAKNPAVIVATSSSRAAVAAAKAAPGTPVVILNVSDPVSRGLAKSLARPEGQFTGVSTAGVETVVKFVEFLKTAVPTLSRIGFLDSTTTGSTMVDSVRRPRCNIRWKSVLREPIAAKKSSPRWCNWRNRACRHSRSYRPRCRRRSWCERHW